VPIKPTLPRPAICRALETISVIGVSQGLDKKPTSFHILVHSCGHLAEVGDGDCLCLEPCAGVVEARVVHESLKGVSLPTKDVVAVLPVPGSGIGVNWSKRNAVATLVALESPMGTYLSPLLR